MSSKASVERLHVGHEPGRSRLRRGHHCGPGHFFGLDAEEIGPKAQVFAALVVLAPVALSGVLLVALAPGFWWIFTTYFWVAFPAFGLLARGVSGFSKRRAEIASTRHTGERELLEALRREGEISPTRAAMETSLSVTEADAMLKELAQAGHLEVRVRGGGLFYAFWEHTGYPAPEIRPAEIRESSKKTS
ncbi:MAG: hypothetical protein M3514_10295 [Actinomycetota bacterium]|nr:hypothetical protein [Actinomycetota bacterium]